MRVASQLPNAPLPNPLATSHSPTDTSLAPLDPRIQVAWLADLARYDGQLKPVLLQILAPLCITSGYNRIYESYKRIGI